MSSLLEKLAKIEQYAIKEYEDPAKVLLLIKIVKLAKDFAERPQKPDALKAALDELDGIL